MNKTPFAVSSHAMYVGKQRRDVSILLFTDKKRMMGKRGSGKLLGRETKTNSIKTQKLKKIRGQCCRVFKQRLS